MGVGDAEAVVVVLLSRAVVVSGRALGSVLSRWAAGSGSSQLFGLRRAGGAGGGGARANHRARINARRVGVARVAGHERRRDVAIRKAHDDAGRQRLGRQEGARDEAGADNRMLCLIWGPGGSRLMRCRCTSRAIG